MTDAAHTIPAARRPSLDRVVGTLGAAERLILTTHVNADGDGAGSEAALAAWLARRGKHVVIVNPTPFPPLYRHLVADPDVVADVGSPAATAALAAGGLLVIMDTSEKRRIDRVFKAWGGRPLLVIDHHPVAPTGITATGVQDPTACATGELVYDLLVVADGEKRTWPQTVPEALYTAITTDTGSFRFSNTTPRSHLIAADLMRRGVDPEAVYRRIYGTVPLRRVELLRFALEHLTLDRESPIAWITIPHRVVEALGTNAEDMDGIIEHARSIEGTEVALLFREIADGSTKVSFRSNGRVDVNALARQFGGGGHVKASGALTGTPLEQAQRDVLDATRAAIAALRSAADV